MADLVAEGVSVEIVLEVAVETVLRLAVVRPESGGWEVLGLRGAEKLSEVVLVTCGMSHSVCRYGIFSPPCEVGA